MGYRLARMHRAIDGILALLHFGFSRAADADRRPRVRSRATWLFQP